MGQIEQVEISVRVRLSRPKIVIGQTEETKNKVKARPNTPKDECGPDLNKVWTRPNRSKLRYGQDRTDQTDN